MVYIGVKSLILTFDPNFPPGTSFSVGIPNVLLRLVAEIFFEKPKTTQAMCNWGKNSNSSVFMITLSPLGKEFLSSNKKSKNAVVELV